MVTYLTVFLIIRIRIILIKSLLISALLTIGSILSTKYSVLIAIRIIIEVNIIVVI